MRQYRYYLYSRIRGASSNVIRCWMSFIKCCCNKCCCARSFTGAGFCSIKYVCVYMSFNTTYALPTHPWDGASPLHPFLSWGSILLPAHKPHWLILLVYSFIYIKFFKNQSFVVNFFSFFMFFFVFSFSSLDACRIALHSVLHYVKFSDWIQQENVTVPISTYNYIMSSFAVFISIFCVAVYLLRMSPFDAHTMYEEPLPSRYTQIFRLLC